MKHTTDDGLVIQSLPDGFAATLRQRVLTAGRFIDNPHSRFDTSCRRLGVIDASHRSDAMFDRRRGIILVAEQHFMTTLQQFTTTP